MAKWVNQDAKHVVNFSSKFSFAPSLPLPKTAILKGLLGHFTKNITRYTPERTKIWWGRTSCQCTSQKVKLTHTVLPCPVRPRIPITSREDWLKNSGHWIQNSEPFLPEEKVLVQAVISTIPRPSGTHFSWYQRHWKEKGQGFHFALSHCLPWVNFPDTAPSRDHSETLPEQILIFHLKEYLLLTRWAGNEGGLYSTQQSREKETAGVTELPGFVGCITATDDIYQLPGIREEHPSFFWGPWGRNRNTHFSVLLKPWKPW